MKKITLKVLLLSVLFLASASLNSQPPPPPADGQHGQQGDSPAGGNAPIGSGLLVLLTLSAAYGTKKAIQFQRSKDNLYAEETT